MIGTIKTPDGTVTGSTLQADLSATNGNSGGTIMVGELFIEAPCTLPLDLISHGDLAVSILYNSTRFEFNAFVNDVGDIEERTDRETGKCILGVGLDVRSTGNVTITPVSHKVTHSGSS